MSVDDELSDSGSIQQAEPKQETAVDKFWARKFGDKGPSGTGKRAILKVAGTGGTKKQKTPSKSTIKGAIMALVEERSSEQKVQRAKVEPGEMTEVGTTSLAVPPSSDPENLMGILDESRQEQ
jgi:hypothetical protein